MNNNYYIKSNTLLGTHKQGHASQSLVGHHLFPITMSCILQEFATQVNYITMDNHLVVHTIYRTFSSKSCHTSTSCCLRNVPTCFCQFIPINATLKISPDGKGSTAIYECAHPVHVHTNRLIIIY